MNTATIDPAVSSLYLIPTPEGTLELRRYHLAAVVRAATNPGPGRGILAGITEDPLPVFPLSLEEAAKVAGNILDHLARIATKNQAAGVVTPLVGNDTTLETTVDPSQGKQHGTIEEMTP
jgi:hypothetical protein